MAEFIKTDSGSALSDVQAIVGTSHNTTGKPIPSDRQSNRHSLFLQTLTPSTRQSLFLRSGSPYSQTHQVKVKVTLQLTVSQSVCLGVEPLLGLMTRYSFRKLQSCPYGALSLTREWVCHLSGSVHGYVVCQYLQIIHK
jgi:hypothetical protein